MKANPVPPRRRRVAPLGLVAVIAMALALLLIAPSARPSLAASGTAADAGDGEPTFRAAEHQLLWSDAFDSRPARAPHSGAEPRYGRYVTRGAPHLQFAPGAGLRGSGAVRIAWAAAPDTGSARCADDSRLLEASFASSRELVVQYSVRYSPGFAFDWSRGGACAGNAKKLLLLWARTGSRFVFISENGWLGVGSDEDHPLLRQDRAPVVTPAALADGRWHRITFHVRQGSAPTRADGFVRGWIDGELRWSYADVVTHNADGYHLIKLPATFNQGSPVAQVEWLDELRIWRAR